MISGSLYYAQRRKRKKIALHEQQQQKERLIHPIPTPIQCKSLSMPADINQVVQDMDPLEKKMKKDNAERILSDYYSIQPPSFQSTSLQSFLPAFEEDSICTNDDVGLCLSGRDANSSVHTFWAELPPDTLQELNDDLLANQVTAQALIAELFSVIGIDEFHLSPSSSPTSVAIRNIEQPASTNVASKTSSSFDNDDNSLDVSKLTREHRSYSLPLVRRSSMRKLRGRSNSHNMVRFNDLQIREYSVALSDHPMCSSGPAIQLGWDFNDKQAVGVDDYEQTREPRRLQHQLALSHTVRRNLLLQHAGYSTKELKVAEDQVNKVKRERLVTDLFLPVCALDETLECVIDSVKRLFV
jgi:hypothetical protein